MGKNVPVILVILIVLVTFGLGIFISPYIISRRVPATYEQPNTDVENPDDDTISVTISDGNSYIYCDWCGDECVELGSRTECPEVEFDRSSYWCGAETVDGNQICQKKLRSDDNEISCDAFNSCSEGKSCYSYSNQGFSRCVAQDEDYCQFCPSGECIVSPETIYPPKINCL
ncbi:hypothetical protein A3I51_00855 [Candidatus Gottesmanbacteria bacterium RIFCSPLOWO2_02_FULL_38_8]|uniref:Uncharacterized protein n=1 Tax=Candidatus Gottesmanbacteria bacterium RIFCSPLOWO2_02_FULL_38_8 TaxID=1798397 RepID=A0A1F6B648_9BACT|nr:MAG: hypothetical protein A3I51_00855 [Candidatus Gottesmanbacteria bacterium RIFCSPLOWO2_02_FULL_38_8]